MTRKQFNNKVRGFIWLVKRKKGIDLGQRYVEESIFEYYAVYRKIPRLYIKGTTFGMADPDEA